MEPLRELALAVGAILLLWLSARKRRRNYPPLPPGPPADPLIGHLRLLPKKHPGVFFHELSKEYGKIMHLRIPGRTMIILNSAQAAVDLLDKRSAIYSDRAPSEVFKLMGWEESIGFYPYGERWRKHRKMLNEHLRRDKCNDYLASQALETRRLVQNILAVPENFIDHLNRFSTAVITRINYGHELVSDDDDYMKILTDAGHSVTSCAAPGMAYLPSWFPGTYPATQARFYRPTIQLMHDYPFEDVQKQMADGKAEPSFLLNHIEGLHREGLSYSYTVEDIKGAAAAMSTAGTDTTWATLVIFVLAMVYFPSVQAKVQKEIDEWTGGDRLPEFNDRPNLPYMECVLQETYRWHNVTPTGIPHRCMEDDIYNGMFIPKGSVIVANARAMTLDEDVYKDPYTFDPSRYLRGEPHPIGHFGFGRRICPGRYLADSSVWIAMASLLAAFNISPATGADGTPAMPEMEFVSGITSHPKPFKCVIIPRNEKVKEMAIIDSKKDR